MIWFLLLHLSIEELFPPQGFSPWGMLIHIFQISPDTALCLPVMCPVFAIAGGRIRGAQGRSNPANPIFLSLLMLTASPAKPLMEL